MDNELYNYITILKKRFLIFITIIIVITLGTYIFSIKQAPGYQATGTVVISQTTTADQSKAPYFTYDNYYSIQASGLFADTILNWLVSPSTVVNIYQKANLPVPQVNGQKLSKIFQTRKEIVTSNVGVFSIQGKDKDEITKLSQAAVELTKEKSTSLGQETSNPYIITTFGPEILTVKTNVLLNTIIAFIASLFLGLLIIYLMEYLTQKPKE